MLLMVTNREKEDGKYGNLVRADYGFDYLYSYDNGKRGKDGFEKTEKKGFENALLSELTRIRNDENTTPKIGLYLHGYNNDYQDCIDELYDIEKHLTPFIKYKPIIVCFSWPSNGSPFDYLDDRTDVRRSLEPFKNFLIDLNNFVTLNEKKCFSTTFCIAHSMGNYLLRKGLEYLSEYLGDPQGRLLFDETVLLAPDIASKHIEMDGKGHYITNFFRRVHVYYSKHDRALRKSSIKRFGANRLGRHGAENYDNLRDNVVIVDAGKYANSESIAGTFDRSGEQVSVHSSHRYHKDILEDIVQVLSSIDRDQIKGRELIVDGGMPRIKGNHYRLI